MCDAVSKLVENDLSKLNLSAASIEDKLEGFAAVIDAVHDVIGLQSCAKVEVEGTQSHAISSNFDCCGVTLRDVIGGLEAKTSDVDRRIEIDLDP